MPTSYTALRAARDTTSDLVEARQRLAAHEAERKSLPPTRRRAELDRLIAEDLAAICAWYRHRTGMKATHAA